MEIYRNASGNSNVYAYEISLDCISVQFGGASRIYTYSYRKAGRHHVENMKQLAKRGAGLNSYINRHAKYLYD